MLARSVYYLWLSSTCLLKIHSGISIKWTPLVHDKSFRFIESPSKNQKSSKVNMKSTICHDVPSAEWFSLTVLQYSTFLFLMPCKYCSSQEITFFLKNNVGLKQNMYIENLKHLNCEIHLIKLIILVTTIKVKRKFFQFNCFHDLWKWPQKKNSLKLNFTTPLHWYSANHKRL